MEKTEVQKQMFLKNFRTSYYIAISVSLVFFAVDVAGLAISAGKSTFMPFEIVSMLTFGIFMAVLFKAYTVLKKLWDSGNITGVRNFLITFGCVAPVIPMLYEFFVMPAFAQFFAISLIASYTLGVAIGGLLFIWRRGR